MSGFNYADIEDFYKKQEDEGQATENKRICLDLENAGANSAPLVKFANQNGLSAADMENLATDVSANPDDLVEIIQKTALAVDPTNFADAMKFMRAMADCSPTCKKELEDAERLSDVNRKKGALEALLTRLRNLNLQDRIAIEARDSLKADLDATSDQVKAYRDRLAASKSEKEKSKSIYEATIKSATENAYAQAMFDPYRRLGALWHVVEEKGLLTPFWLEKYGKDIVLGFSEPTNGYRDLSAKKHNRGANQAGPTAPVDAPTQPAPAPRLGGLNPGVS